APRVSESVFNAANTRAASSASAGTATVSTIGGRAFSSAERGVGARCGELQAVIPASVSATSATPVTALRLFIRFIGRAGCRAARAHQQSQHEPDAGGDGDRRDRMVFDVPAHLLDHL